MKSSDDRYRAKDRMLTHHGETLHRDRRPTPDKAEKQRRLDEKEIDAKAAMAEHEQREKAKLANMERLKAERLARGGL